MKIIKSDNGREFVNNDSSAYFTHKGIVHQTTSSYTPLTKWDRGKKAQTPSGSSKRS